MQPILLQIRPVRRANRVLALLRMAQLQASTMAGDRAAHRHPLSHMEEPPISRCHLTPLTHCRHRMACQYNLSHHPIPCHSSKFQCNNHTRTIVLHRCPIHLLNFLRLKCHTHSAMSLHQSQMILSDLLLADPCRLRILKCGRRYKKGQQTKISLPLQTFTQDWRIYQRQERLKLVH